MLSQLYTPNEIVARRTVVSVYCVLTGLWLGAWTLFRPPTLPSPIDVLQAVPILWTEHGLFAEIVSSMTVNVEALLLSVAIALPLAYTSRIPVASPIGNLVSGMRFVGTAVFFLLLLTVVKDGHWIKVWMLAIGELCFLTRSAMSIVRSVPDIFLDDCRVQGMSEWYVTWYAIIRGTQDQMISAVRDNAAMGLAMLMFVEGIVQSEGGLGLMAHYQERIGSYAAVYAIAFVVLALGIAQDWVLTQVERLACPWLEKTS